MLMPRMRSGIFVLSPFRTLKISAPEVRTIANVIASGLERPSAMRMCRGTEGRGFKSRRSPQSSQLHMGFDD
jgi:hypothetical protein